MEDNKFKLYLQIVDYFIGVAILHFLCKARARHHKITITFIL
jgi:hypothetical protein